MVVSGILALDTDFIHTVLLSGQQYTQMGMVIQREDSNQVSSTLCERRTLFTFIIFCRH
jgi:hypothetical protein